MVYTVLSMVDTRKGGEMKQTIEILKAMEASDEDG